MTADADRVTLADMPEDVSDRFGRIGRWLTVARLENPRFILAVWFVSRFVVLLGWVVFAPSNKGDVQYYYNAIAQMGQAGAAHTLTEYPTPVIWFMLVPWYLGGGTLTGFVFVFMSLMLALDAAFTVTLWRAAGPLRGPATLVWIVFLLLLGPLPFMRFDLVTSVLSGWALLLVLRQRPVWGGGLVGVGAAIKLWPALLWPALCGGSRRHNIKATLGVAVFGGLFALGALVYGGWDRLLSPLDYQSGRGLQVESIWATGPMLARAFHLGDYAVTLSRFQAFEIWGTGVPGFAEAAGVAAIAGYVLIAGVYVTWWTRGAGRLMEACVLMLLVVTTLIVTNKTLSPQYLLWLAGPLASAYATMGSRNPHNRYYVADRNRLTRITRLILAIGALTLVVFPIGYTPLVSDTRAWTAVRVFVTLVLAVRNVGLLWLLGELLVWVVRFCSPTAFRAARDRRPVEEPAGRLTARLKEAGERARRPVLTAKGHTR
ncbi:MAG: glycosyltransferase 87 family protein [Actinomycetia bacterium]|nr:glycosyltransferase 87 family protein [Actinomycetes bacterium]